MLTSFPFAAAIGCLLGFLAGLGVGGGTLLLLWLTAVLNMPQPEARAINLLFFIPTALISSFFHRRKGTLNLKTVSPAMISGCLFAALGSWLSKRLDVGLLRKMFGFLLIATGIRELFYRRRNPK
jgi:uncharacterized membrane protein YfcA